MTSTIKLRARKARNEEQYHEYATTALDILRTLEFAHHTDPVLTPRPYISSIQLRDNVLSHIRSGFRVCHLIRAPKKIRWGCRF